MPSRKRGSQLPRLWIDSSLCSYKRSLHTPASTLSSAPFSAAISAATISSCGPSTADAFHVLCLYDFTSDDPDQLSFKKNEILDIIKRENTGWWAAVRPGHDCVGWIPSTFVEAISENKLLGSNGEKRIYDHIRKMYGSPVIPKGGQLLIASPGGETGEQDWVPLPDDEQAPVMQLFSQSAKDCAPFAFSPLIPPHEGIDSTPLNFHDSDSDSSPDNGIMSRLIPNPGSSNHRMLQVPPSRGPPAPNDSASSLHKHLLPSPTSSTARHSRPRPVLIDDCSSLNRLSTLFETKNVEELGSPLIAETLDSFSRAATGQWSDVLKQSHEIQVRHDGMVTAGSLHNLLEKLTDDPAWPPPYMKFHRIFLMTFRTFTTAEESFNFLSKQFHMTAPAGLGPKELEQWEETKLHPLQSRVLSILKIWSEEYGMYQYDRQIVRQVVDLLSSVTAPPLLAVTAQAMIQSVERLMSGVSRAVPGKKNLRKAKIELLRMDPAVVGQHLSMYEHRLYSKIRPQQCIDWGRSRDDVADLITLRATHHKLGAWVKSSILSADSSKKRANMVDFWICVAESCKLLNNVSSASTVVSVLSSDCVPQLHPTWADTSRKARLDILSTFIQSSGRPLAPEQADDVPCVPHIERYLRDIIHTNEQYQDYTVVPVPFINSTVSLINFAKREKWFDIVQAMLCHQSKTFDFPEDATFMEFIAANLETPA
ncbi:ras guanine nucleotide exchange factor domain-containing protein [Sparassis latifolia]